MFGATKNTVKRNTVHPQDFHPNTENNTSISNSAPIQKQAQTNFLKHTHLQEYAQEFPLQFEKFKEFAHKLERFLLLDFEYDDEQSKKNSKPLGMSSLFYGGLFNQPQERSMVAMRWGEVVMLVAGLMLFIMFGFFNYQPNPTYVNSLSVVADLSLETRERVQGLVVFLAGIGVLMFLICIMIGTICCEPPMIYGERGDFLGSVDYFNLMGFSFLWLFLSMEWLKLVMCYYYFVTHPFYEAIVFTILVYVLMNIGFSKIFTVFVVPAAPNEVLQANSVITMSNPFLSKWGKRKYGFLDGKLEKLARERTKQLVLNCDIESDMGCVLCYIFEQKKKRDGFVGSLGEMFLAKKIVEKEKSF